MLPALWLGGQRVFGDDGGGNRNDTPIPDVTSTRTPTATPTPTASPSATSSPSATAPAASLTRVAASPPRRLTVRSLDVGFDDFIESQAGVFQAASTSEAARWGSRGVPASPGTDTVFLIGKVYTQGASAFAGLGAVRAGDVVTLRTQNVDILKYTVSSTATRPASGMLRSTEFTAKVPGRLVLAGILYDGQDDQRTGRYLVVIAQLSGATSG